MKKALYILILAGLTLISACRKEHKPDTPSDRDYITFYVPSNNHIDFSAKSIIEDTDDLRLQAPDLNVVDEGSKEVFKSSSTNISTTLNHYANGIWRSAVKWESNLTYYFYGYISSPAEKDDIKITNNNGKQVTITEPATYSDDPNKWSDYLMSYRVRVDNGEDAPLVKLEMERITAGVQLFVTQSVGAGITVKDITFTNVETQASYSLTYHAAPENDPRPGNNNMKNEWGVSNAFNLHNYTLTYNRAPAEIQTGDSKFSEKNRVMNFIAVDQSMAKRKDETGETFYSHLIINYSANENGKEIDYTADFDLSTVATASWGRGHRTRYYINLDTGIELEGSIVPWITIDDIEVTILPPIPSE